MVLYVESAGYRSVHIPASQYVPIVDWEALTGQVSHREVARRAGLGFIGRNNLLVTRRYGAGVRLVSVLTDMPLVEGSSVEGCGDCRECIAVSPAGAIRETSEGFDLAWRVEKLRSFNMTVGHHICEVLNRAYKTPNTG